MNAFPPPAASLPSPAPSRDDLVASAAGWVAVSLNLGCQGAGYIYQRRWGAFWIGGLAAVGSAVVLAAGAALLVSNNPQLTGRLQGQQQTSEQTAAAVMVGVYAGVLAVGIGSAVEAGLAVKRARRRLGRGH